MRRLFVLLTAAVAAGGAAGYGIQATAAGTPSRLAVDVGQVVQVSEAEIACKIVRRDGLKSLDCRRAGPLPGSVGVLFNRRRVVVERFLTPTTARIVFSAKHSSQIVQRCS